MAGRGGAGDAAQRCDGRLAVCACAPGVARQCAGCVTCRVDSRLTYVLVGARRMPRARRGVVSPADAAAARKRLLEAQLGEAKAAKAAKSSKSKSPSGVVASPKSERVDPPGSPSTSSSAPGNKKVELKPVSPPVRPEPQKALEEECKACQGAHRAHTVRCLLPDAHGNPPLSTPAPKMCCGSADPFLVLQCGKSRATPAPRRQTTKVPPATNHSKSTRKRRATTKAAPKLLSVPDDEEQTILVGKVSWRLTC